MFGLSARLASHAVWCLFHAVSILLPTCPSSCAPPPLLQLLVEALGSGSAASRLTDSSPAGRAQRKRLLLLFRCGGVGAAPAGGLCLCDVCWDVSKCWFAWPPLPSSLPVQELAWQGDAQPPAQHPLPPALHSVCGGGGGAHARCRAAAERTAGRGRAVAERRQRRGRCGDGAGHVGLSCVNEPMPFHRCFDQQPFFVALDCFAQTPLTGC